MSGIMDDWKSRFEEELRDGADELREGASDLLASIGGGLKRILQRRELSDEELAVRYREAFARRIRSERAGLSGHTVSYLGVNTVLTGIWAMTGGGFPWFLFPLFGWGIGYCTHWVTAKAREGEYREVTAARHPTRKQLQIHRDLWKARRNWRGHLTSNGTTIALLGMVNIVTGSVFPWALIPSGFIAVGLFSHYGRYRHRSAELAEALEREGFRLDGPGGDGVSLSQDVVKEAKVLRGAILADVKGYPEVADALGTDVAAVLDEYISQIGSLSTTYQEVTGLLKSIPLEELRQETLQLQRRIAAAADDRLKGEYRRRLDQLRQQMKSHDELQAEQEILRLRISGALQALNQLKIDIARVRSSRSAGDGAGHAELRAKSAEISRYLEDLRAAWDEIS